jgi:hypothetical protein
MFNENLQLNRMAAIQRAIKKVNDAKHDEKNKEASSVQEDWDKLASNQLIGRMIKDSKDAARKGEPKKVKNPLRDIL